MHDSLGRGRNNELYYIHIINKENLCHILLSLLIFVHFN